MHTKRLSKYSLDLAVLVADGYTVYDHPNPGSVMAYKGTGVHFNLYDLKPSRNERFGLALLAREGIEVQMETITGPRKTTHVWHAAKTVDGKVYRQTGNTKLTAGLRCYVNWKIGETFAFPFAVRKRMQEYRAFDSAMDDSVDPMGYHISVLKQNYEMVTTGDGRRMYQQKESARRTRTPKKPTEASDKATTRSKKRNHVRRSRHAVDSSMGDSQRDWVIRRPDGSAFVVQPITSQRRNRKANELQFTESRCGDLNYGTVTHEKPLREAGVIQ